MAITKHKGRRRSWAATYLSIFAIYALIGICLLMINSSTGILVGLVGTILTLPWGWITVPVLDAFGYIAWYDGFVDQPFIYGLLAMLGMLPGALINALIIHIAERKSR